MKTKEQIEEELARLRKRKKVFAAAVPSDGEDYLILENTIHQIVLLEWILRE